VLNFHQFGNFINFGYFKRLIVISNVKFLKMLLEKLEIPAGIDTPYVNLNAKTGVCHFTGKSYPDDIAEFYGRIVQWFEEYIYSGVVDLTINMKLTYYNSSSQKIYTDIFEKLHAAENFKTVVNWYHAEDDEDMLDAGQELCKLVDVPFNFLTYKRK
jgi:hypothetical protein